MSTSSSRSTRRLSRAAAALIAPALLLGAAAAANAAAGDLDPTWSGNGVATQGSGASVAQASAGTTDGRLVVAGTGTVPDGTPSNGGTCVSPVLLSLPTNAGIGDGSAVGTVRNED